MNAAFYPRALRLAAGFVVLISAYALVSVLTAADKPAKPPDRDADSPKQTLIFRLKYARAAEINRVLKDVFGNRLTLGVDDRTNAIILVGTAAELAEVRSVIDRIDEASKDADAGRPSLLLLGTVIIAGLAWHHFVLRKRANGWAPQVG